jgi:hypothetical protein
MAVSVEVALLQRERLTAPDGRPLLAWNCDPDQRQLLAASCQHLMAGLPFTALTAARFVLWAAEEIRTQHRPGQLTWDWLFGRLGRPPAPQLGRDLTERGLAWWGRRVRISEGGARQFLYSLMAEGGMPDAYLAEAARYRSAVLSMLAEIEQEGALAEAAAERVAWRRVGDLPHAFRHPDTVLLLADLALALARLRARLPGDLPAQAAEAWLDRQAPGWRQQLPLRLSAAALEALIRPALQADRGRPARPPGPLCRRELRRLAAAPGWGGYAVIGDGALLAGSFLPEAGTGRRLRLLALGDDAAAAMSFLAVPEDHGWVLSRAGSGAEALRLAPHRPLLAAAHADGRLVGEAILDAGIPPAEFAPSVWRACDQHHETPARLELLGGAARTRAPHLWLLTGPDAEPVAETGVEIGVPEPAPGGCLWRVSGQGRIAVGTQAVEIATGADAEAGSHRLHVFGRVLPGWRSEDGQLPLLGRPEIWGEEGDGQLRRLSAGVAIFRTPTRLGGRIAEWRDGGMVLARAGFLELPAGLRLGLAEGGAGSLRLDAEGLEEGWHVRLQAAGESAAVQVGTDGRATLSLEVPGTPPARARLRLSDPRGGTAIVLVAAWPARRGLVIGPDDTRLMRDRTVAVGALAGWRGIVPPGQAGGLLLRPGPGASLGIPVAGEVRLAAAEPIARLMLGLGGLDAELPLHLVVGGDEGRRLTVKRYATEGGTIGRFRAAGGTWRLHALALDPPSDVRTLQDVTGVVEFAEWLGETGTLWLVQARAETGELARPMAWSSATRPHTTRDARIAAYAEAWRGLMAEPLSTGWDAAWQLIRAARDGGDAGALDQVQALGEAPAAAIALLLRVSEAGLSEALALEGAAPLWWPATPLQAWRDGVAVELDRRRAALAAAGFEGGEVAEIAAQAIARRAWTLLALRPELKGHLAAGFLGSDLVPLARGTDPRSGLVPLQLPDAAATLRALAQEVARRAPELPDGSAHPGTARRSLAAGFAERLRPLLDAPLLVAEIAAGEVPASRGSLMHLIALRQADPHWFDAALPAAVQQHIEDART